MKSVMREGQEPGTPADVKGRCIYCDERCDVNAPYHQYCRDQYEHETRTAAAERERAERRRERED